VNPLEWARNHGKAVVRDMRGCYDPTSSLPCAHAHTPLQCGACTGPVTFLVELIGDFRGFASSTLRRL
jgi:hypothetical protein